MVKLNVDVIYKVKTFLFVIIHDTNVYIEQQYKRYSITLIYL